MLTVGSLFAGIGGFDLGLERAGMQVKWQVEIDPYCLKVLEKHWPHVRRYTDIKTVDWSAVEPVDLVCGGFPCQDLSVAGKRVGIDGERSGLWSEYVRCLRALRPRYVLVENVPGMLNAAMGRVLGDLADSGYDAEWQIISAAAVGAPHLRKRVWIVAYPNSLRLEEYGLLNASIFERPSTPGTSHQPKKEGVADSEQPAIATNTNQRTERQQDDGPTLRPESDSGRQIMANAAFDGQPRTGDTRTGQDGLENGGRDVSNTDHATTTRQREHSQQIYPKPESARLNGSSSENWWTVEPNVGRVAHGVPARVDRLRGLGNAVVPQVVEWIGRQILKAEEVNRNGQGVR